VHPVDVNTVRKRSVANGDMNPFQELALDSDLERLVILEMAKQRQTAATNNGSTPGGGGANNSNGDEEEPQQQEPVSRIISEGFYWKEYPVCEQVLYNHMDKYYEISAIKKDYKVQQEFNNVLVEQVRAAALEGGFEVDPNFDDKKLRDRIRCFFKTHLQNAKKRLATLQKHADSPDNQALVAVFIRMVRNPNLTYEASLAQGQQENHHPHLLLSNSSTNSKATTTAKKKRRRLTMMLPRTTAATPSVTTTANDESQQQPPVSSASTSLAGELGSTAAPPPQNQQQQQLWY